MQVDDVGLWQDVLVVTEDASNGKPTVDQKWHYFAIDGAQPTPIAGVRDRFDPQGAGLVDGVATIVGRVDETPDMDSDDEVEQVLVIAFESGSAATVDELEVSAFGTVAVRGDHVLIGDRDDGVLQVYTLDGLEETASVTVPPPEPFETGDSFSINEDCLLVIDGSQILNYR